MQDHSKDELSRALQVVISTINNCENIMPKFAEGTSQHTLLKNRIKAMYISKALIANEDEIGKFTQDDFIEALNPVKSIISKCEKAQIKFDSGTPQHTRFKTLIDAMYISKQLITDHITENEIN